MSELHIRRAKPKDMDAVLDLWQEMMAYHARLDPRFLPTADSRDHFETTLQQWMMDDQQRVLVALQGDRIVGYTIGRVAENPPLFEPRFFGHVSDICVAPDWRRKGVGRRLFAALCQWFQRQGISVVQLHVAAANAVSQAFWREMGFDLYMHRMWLDLAPDQGGDK
jgi:ribosomal protein S18 acetylase RimI-like enzyme